MTQNTEKLPELIDVHSHILPGMDDGPKTVEEALAMLEAAYRQGVRHIWSTSHFYPQKEDPASFLKRRAEAAGRLKAGWRASLMPKIYLGAEVAYFFGLGRCKPVRDLTVGGSPFLLVEMPPERWSDDVVDDLLMVRYVLGLRPIIAHVERCLPEQPKKIVRRLSEEGVYFQSNASFLGDIENNKRDIRTMIKEELIDLMGSDCHSIDRRKPNLAAGFRGFAELADDELIAALRGRAARMTGLAVPFIG